MLKKVTLEHLDQKIDQKIDALSGEMRDFVEFVKDNVVMRGEFQSGLLEVRSEILTVADQVTKLQETVEIELVAPTRRVDRLERRVTVVERKLGLAT